MKNLIYLLTFVFFASCAEKDIFENKKVYYKFNGSDFDNIPTKYSQIGSFTNYKNDNGESIEIKNVSYNLRENIYLTGELFDPVYYHDNLFISLSIKDQLVFDFYIDKFENNLLEYKIGIVQYYYLYYPKENDLLTEKFINNILYKKVRVFELSKDVIINISPTVTIDKIYFDLKAGVIGLEDSANNNQFWISN